MDNQKGTANRESANSYFTLMNYLQQTHLDCYSSCVVDFQSKDISAMEKECAMNCIKKHMAIYPDLQALNVPAKLSLASSMN